MTPHMVTKKNTNLWWLLRGVNTGNYRNLCRRCGHTGQAHVGFWVSPGNMCVRFKAHVSKKETESKEQWN